MILLPCCPCESAVSVRPIETSKVWLKVVMRLRSADIYKHCLPRSNWISTATGRKGLSVLAALVSMLLCLLSSKLTLLSTPFAVFYSHSAQRHKKVHEHRTAFKVFMYVNCFFQIGLKVLHILYLSRVHKADCTTIERYKITCMRLSLVCRPLFQNQGVICITGPRTGLGMMCWMCYYRILSTYVNPVIRSVIITLLFSSFVPGSDCVAIQTQL